MAKRLNKPLPKDYESFFYAQECKCISNEKKSSDFLTNNKNTDCKNNLSLNIPLIILVLLSIFKND